MQNNATVQSRRTHNTRARHARLVRDARVRASQPQSEETDSTTNATNSGDREGEGEEP